MRETASNRLLSRKNPLNSLDNSGCSLRGGGTVKPHIKHDARINNRAPGALNEDPLCGAEECPTASPLSGGVPSEAQPTAKVLLHLWLLREGGIQTATVLTSTRSPHRLAPIGQRPEFYASFLARPEGARAFDSIGRHHWNQAAQLRPYKANVPMQTQFPPGRRLGLICFAPLARKIVLTRHNSESA
jgi:hypothetical protein